MSVSTPGEDPPVAVSRVAPFIIGCALLMQGLDGTAIAVALPAIARSLGEDPLRVNLAITAYLLCGAIFIPISGWIAEKLGPRRVFCAAIVLFVATSLLCGLSQSLLQLVAARALQGMAGAMMTPVARLVVLRTTARADIVSAMSMLTIPMLIGPVLGPLVGGAIVSAASWRWIFFVNAPIGLIGLLAVFRYVPNLPPTLPGGFDYRGFFLAGSGIAGLVLGFSALGHGDGGFAAILMLIAVGALCAGLYVLHARRAASPIIDLALLRIPAFRISVIEGGIWRTAMGAIPILLTLLLQLGFGWDPLAAGAVTFVSALGALAMKATAPRILRRYGFRRVLIVNGVISALLLASFAAFTAATPLAAMVVVLLFSGFLRSLEFTALGALTYADIPQAALGKATGFASMMQELSGSVGAGLAAVLVQSAMALRGPSASLAASDVSFAFLVCGALALAASMAFFRLERNAGAGIAGTPDA